MSRTAPQVGAQRTTGPRPGGGGPLAGMQGPPQKPLNFGPSVKRLLRLLRPERAKVALVLGLTIVSIVLNVLGPRILGHATDIIFEGFVGGRLPSGVSKAEAISGLRDQGENTLADMLAAMDVIPGQGIDFSALTTVLLGVLALYLGASVFNWVQGYVLAGVVQRTMYRLRADVEAKLHRLPLRHFDQAPRGDVLSRVTNDIDNVAQSLQQTLSQMLTALLTVFGVLTMMLIISPLLALIALVTVPLSVVATALIAKRSQVKFVDQWRHTGDLNAQIEEAYTGHAVVKVFGRHDELQRTFRAKNEELFQSSFGAQFISGSIRPVMMFLGSLNYVAIAVVGGLRVASGSMSLGEVQAFIQYSQQFTQPLTQLASMLNLLQSGVASAERVFEFLDLEEESAEQSGSSVSGGRADVTRGRVEFENVSFSYDPEKPLIENL